MTSPPMPGGWTATEIAAAVRGGTLTPRAATASALARIAEHDGALGAFQLVRAGAALAEADAVAARPDLADLPLAGVPIAIKDNVDVAGEPTRSGSTGTPDGPRPDDHEVVRRLRAAGAVVVGKTTVPELCLYAATESPFGVARNPWDRDRTPGGSSGGSAAAVAAGLVPAAHGNDGLGSIRIPAACCGLVGLKPGSGVVPAGIGGNDWYGMSENGPLATTVADVALLLAVMADRPDLAAPEEPARPLRLVASISSPIAGVGVDPEHARAVVRTVGRLTRAGHSVQRRTFTVPNRLAGGVFARWFGGASYDADGVDRAQLSRAPAAHVLLGDQVRRFRLVTDAQREGVGRLAEEFLGDADAYLTPVLARPPLPAQRWSTRSLASVLATNVRFAPFSAPWNLLGWPAVAVPAGVHPVTGTPLAVQVVTRPGGEALLLGLAAQLERLQPWPRTAPGY